MVTCARDVGEDDNLVSQTDGLQNNRMMAHTVPCSMQYVPSP